jgi:hypothetical protein
LAIVGLAALITLNRVLFPAFGAPTIPTSATNFSSKSSHLPTISNPNKRREFNVSKTELK